MPGLENPDVILPVFLTEPRRSFEAKYPGHNSDADDCQHHRISPEWTDVTILAILVALGMASFPRAPIVVLAVLSSQPPKNAVARLDWMLWSAIAANIDMTTSARGARTNIRSSRSAYQARWLVSTDAARCEGHYGSSFRCARSDGVLRISSWSGMRKPPMGLARVPSRSL